MRDVHDQIRRVIPLVEAGHRHDVRVSVGINQISFAPDEYVATYSAAMHEAGAPEIMLYDGGSGMGPEAYAFMVGLVYEHAPDAVVGVHTQPARRSARSRTASTATPTFSTTTACIRTARSRSGWRWRSETTR